MTTMNIALWAALAAAVSSALTYFIMKARTAALLGEKDSEIAGKDMEIARMEAEIRIKAAEAQNQEGNMEALQKAHEKDLLTIKAEMMIQTEKILKEREEQLSKKAEETFKTISGNIGKELKDMKQAFDANKQTQTENSSSLKTQLEEAVKHLREQAGSIGTKADHLADALKGRNKMQGCWGETILNNIFIQEGLIEGRDYDKEETMKDEMGIAILNEDSGKRMRPDFILHFPDNTDIIVDSKVSLSALADWVEAQDEKRREDAARRNLQSVKEQIKNLASKSYYDKSAGGRRTLGYVVMFIPNYGALQLAKQLEPGIVNDAFKQNVLITTEETIMPFLRMIRNAWINVEQVRNQEKIIKAAQTMVERVADFCDANATVGRKLQDAVEAYDKGTKKLQDGGQSIVKAANDVIKLGVPINPKKVLPGSE